MELRRTKEKRSFSVSQEGLEILLAFKSQSKAPSLSAALDLLLRQHRNQRKLAALDESIANYYDTLDEESVAGQEEWGKFASAQFCRIRGAKK